MEVIKYMGKHRKTFRKGKYNKSIHGVMEIGYAKDVK